MKYEKIEKSRHNHFSHLLYRYGARKANNLALEIISTNAHEKIADPFVRVLLAGRALGLEIANPNEYESGKSHLVIAKTWSNYENYMLLNDITHLFPDASTIDKHASYPIYQNLASKLNQLKNRKTSEQAMIELFKFMRENKDHLISLFAEDFTNSIIPEATISAYKIFGINNLLSLLQKHATGLNQILIEDMKHLIQSLNLAKLLAEADFWLPCDLNYLTIAEEAFNYDNKKIIESLYEWAPDNVRRVLVAYHAFNIQDFHDRDFYTKAIEDNIPSAIISLCKLWPDEVSAQMIRSLLEKGLHSDNSDIVTSHTDHEVAKLSTFGNMVSNAIYAAKYVLHHDEIQSYYKRFLMAEGLEKLKIDVLDELTDCEDESVDEIIAQNALTASGWLLTAIAETIENHPSESGLNAIFSRLLDRSLKLDRLPIIDALAEHRPDDDLRNKLLIILDEQGCRCGGCVWR